MAGSRAIDRIDMRLVVRLLGLAFILVGAVGFALMIVGAGAATKVVSIDVLTTGPVRWTLGVVGSLIAIISPVFLVVGSGLVRQAPWAHPLAFAVAMMCVFNFPIGTLLALVTFVVLGRSDAKRLFASASGASASLQNTGAGAGNAAPVHADRLPDTVRPVTQSGLGQAAPAAIVTISYDLTLDDLVAFAEYHSAHSPAVRRNYYWSLAIGAVLVLVLLWMFGFRTVGGWAGAVVAIVGWVVYLNWRTRTGNRRYFRRVYSEGANRGMLGLHRLSANAHGLMARTEVTDASTTWSGVERIEETSGMAFIYVGALSAYAIPEARVLEGNFREFLATIRRLHADASHAP
jgi:hypothetical protein